MRPYTKRDRGSAATDWNPSQSQNRPPVGGESSRRPPFTAQARPERFHREDHEEGLSAEQKGPPARRRSAGFTLLEVLVALTILAVSLGALIKAGSEHTRNTHYLQERTLAHWTGQNLIARYEAGLLQPRGGSQRGTLRQAGQDWDYRVEIREEVPEGPLELPPVLRVEVSVWLASGSPDDVRARVVGYLLP